MDIFFYEAFDEEARTLRHALPEGLSAGFDWKTIQERHDSAPPASLISIRTQSIIPPEWADRLEGIISRSTGYDHLTAYRCTCRSNLPCGYLPLYCNRAVAEQALLLWMALLRKLPQQQQNVKTFHRDGLTGRECRSQNLLVVGVGNIGCEIVKIGRGLEMSVRGVDLVERHTDVDYTTIDQGLPWANIIVCAMNLTPDNLGYFDYTRLNRTSPGAFFINIARGEMSPSADLLRLLREDHLAGVGLDTYNRESELAVTLRLQTSSDDPEIRAALELADHSRAILTPHNAFNTLEAVDRKADHTIRQITHFLQHHRFLWPIPE